MKSFSFVIPRANRWDSAPPTQRVRQDPHKAHEQASTAKDEGPDTVIDAWRGPTCCAAESDLDLEL